MWNVPGKVPGKTVSAKMVPEKILSSSYIRHPTCVYHLKFKNKIEDISINIYDQIGLSLLAKIKKLRQVAPVFPTVLKVTRKIHINFLH